MDCGDIIVILSGGQKRLFVIADKKWHGNRKHPKFKDTAVLKTTSGTYEVRKHA